MTQLIVSEAFFELGFMNGVVLANFDICEASYGQTVWDGSFLKNRFKKYNLDLVIPFKMFLPILSTIWLTAVKYVFPAFFQRNKDPRAKMGIF